MSELKALIKEIKDTTKTANLQLEGTDPKTRPGREMLRNAAREKLEVLKNDYKTSLTKSAFIMLPSGKDSKTFADLAKDMDAIVVDVAELYSTLALRCQQTMGARQTFGLTQFLVLQGELRGLAISTKTDLINPEFGTEVQALSLPEITDIIRELVEKSNGQKLLKTYIEGQALNLALEQEADSKVVPIVVLNIPTKQQDSLIGTLFRGKGLQVDTNKEEVNPEFIKHTFEYVKKLLKG